MIHLHITKHLHTNTVQFKGECFACKGEVTIEAPASALYAYQKGALMQDAFPMLDAGQREFLISGTCNACFDRMFAEPDEDEREGAPDAGEESDPASPDEHEHDDPMGWND